MRFWQQLVRDSMTNRKWLGLVIIIMVVGAAISGGFITPILWRNYGYIYLIRTILDPNSAIPQARIQRAFERSNDRRGLAHLAAFSGDQSKALDYFKDVVVDQPNDVVSNYYLGELYFGMGDYEKAIETWRRADPINIAQLLSHTASEELAMGDMENARTLSELAIAVAPDYAPALYQAGKVYASIGQDEAAISAYIRFTIHEQDRAMLANGYRNLGDLYKRRGELDKAIAAYQLAMGLDPANMDSAISLLRLYIYNQMYNEAEKLGGNILDAEPEFITGIIAMGELYQIQGDLERARSWYQKVREIDPHSGAGEASLGILEVETGNPSVAIEHLTVAVELEPEMRSWWRWLGIACRKAGKFEQAIDSFNQALSSPGYEAPDVETLVELARTYDQIGMEDLALNTWQEVLRLDPDNPEALKAREQ